MIQNNPTNLVAAFEMLLEEIEAEIEFTNKVALAPSKPATTTGPGRRSNAPRNHWLP